MIFDAPLGYLLAGSAAAITKRVVAALGFGFVTFTGFQEIKGEIVQGIQSAINAIPADVFAIAAKAGFIDMVGIWLGAATTVISFLMLKRFMPIV